MVGVLLEPGVDLHLPGVQHPLVVAEGLPRGEGVRAWRQLGICGDDAQGLLPGEGLLPKDVPALVELPAVLLAPLRWDVMRRMRAPRRVVGEPRLGLVLGADGVQPGDRVVRQRVRQVELLTVDPLRNADDGVVLGDERVVLPRLRSQEPPEVLEAPAHRPSVMRTGRTLDPVRGQVPLAEPPCRVPVVAKHPDHRGARPRQDAGVTGERPGELPDRAEPHRVAVAPRQHRGPGRRAHRRDVEPVVGQALLTHATHVRGVHRPAERARVAEPGVVEEDQQNVGRALRRGRHHVDRPVGDRDIQGPPLGTTEPRIGHRKHRAVRAELAHGLRQGRLQRGDHAALVVAHQRPQQRAGKGPLDGQEVLVLEHRDDPRRPQRKRLADLVADPRLELVIGQLADQRTRAGAHQDRGEDRGREQPHRQANTAAPTRPPAPRAIPGVRDGDLTVQAAGHQDHPLHPDRLGRDQRDDRVEILCRCGDVLVTSHQDVQCRVVHAHLLCLGSGPSAGHGVAGARSAPSM